MLSSQIKEYTKEAHQQLEKIVIGKLKNIKNDGDYATLLKYFYAYFSSLEKAIAPFIDKNVLVDFPDRRKADRLKHDIISLGGSVEDLPAVETPNIQSAAAAMGALYVMEGSVMGGSIIVGMLQTNGITKGLDFFSGYGAETQDMWQQFISALNTTAKNEQETEEIVKSAKATFTNFAKAFDRQ